MATTTTNRRPWLPQRRIAERAWLIPACALLVLAGLVGMHGLSDHGISTPDEPAMSGQVMASASAVPHTGDHAASARPGSLATVAHHAMPHHGGMGHMDGLCLAILTGLLLGLAGWLSTQRLCPLFEKLLRLIPLARPRGRDPDPPSLARLSVLRC